MEDKLKELLEKFNKEVLFRLSKSKGIEWG